MICSSISASKCLGRLKKGVISFDRAGFGRDL
jgi:hypothetical protein